jgi:hypothetical protein
MNAKTKAPRKMRQAVELPPPALTWATRPKVIESDVSTRTNYASTCGRYSVSYVEFKLKGLRNVWQLYGPQWAGISRITAKIGEYKNQQAAQAAAESYHRAFMAAQDGGGQ